MNISIINMNLPKSKNNVTLYHFDFNKINRMQSIAPNIIKHFIPIEFSKNVLDFQVVTKKATNKKEQNPLQNMKLRNLDKQSQRQLVLTYKNKTNALYRSKKSIKYQHLFRQLEEEHKKLNLIKEEVKKSQKQDTAKQSILIRSTKPLVNELNFEEKNQINERAYSSYRKIHTNQMKKRINLSSRRRTAQETTKRPLSHRLYSSINFRQYNKKILADYSKNSQYQNSPSDSMQKISMKRLRIRGRQAPQSQMIDHLKRSSTSTTDMVIHINRNERK